MCHLASMNWQNSDTVWHQTSQSSLVEAMPIYVVNQTLHHFHNVGHSIETSSCFEYFYKFISTFTFKIQKYFIVNFYWSIHKMFDMLSSTYTTKVHKYIYFQDSRSFIANLYRSIHNMFDMLSSTNTAKGGLNHVWLINPLFNYSNFPNVLWA